MFCGTPSYMAPELICKIEYDGFKADIWALGILLYAILCGKFPFKSTYNKDLYRKIKVGNFEFPDGVGLSISAKQLISKMLSNNPVERPTAKDVLNNQWFLN